MASDADREKVIDMLKAAFARGSLTKEVLDLRLGQTFAARTYAALAVLTADLPAVLPGTEPVRKPGRVQPRQPASKAVVWSAFGVIALALLAATLAVPSPTPTDDNHLSLILFLVTVVYFTAWLVTGAQMLGTWHRQRSRQEAGRDLTESSSPAVRE